jgi:hypothetical protein
LIAELDLVHPLTLEVIVDLGGVCREGRERLKNALLLLLSLVFFDSSQEERLFG